MVCYSGGAKGLVLDYAARRRRRDGAAHAGDAGEAAGHDRSRPRARRIRSTSARWSACSRRNSPRSARSSAPTRPSISSPCRGCMPVNPADPYNPEPLRVGARFDRQADAGVRPHRAERLRHQPQVPGRDRRAVHSGPAGDGAGAAGPRALCRGPAARRCGDCRSRAGARKILPAQPSTRCSATHGLTLPQERARRDAGRGRGAGRRASAFRWR